jgi:hypothetical protein
MWMLFIFIFIRRRRKSHVLEKYTREATTLLGSKI